jgi:hypothetical protein
VAQERQPAWRSEGGTPLRSEDTPRERRLAPAMPNGRCRLHGGLSTGPKTAEGIDRIRRAVTKHGRYSAATKLRRERYVQILLGPHFKGKLELLESLREPTGAKIRLRGCTSAPPLLQRTRSRALRSLRRLTMPRRLPALIPPGWHLAGLGNGIHRRRRQSH